MTCISVTVCRPRRITEVGAVEIKLDVLTSAPGPVRRTGHRLRRCILGCGVPSRPIVRPAPMDSPPHSIGRS